MEEITWETFGTKINVLVILNKVLGDTSSTGMRQGEGKKDISDSRVASNLKYSEYKGYHA